VEDEGGEAQKQHQLGDLNTKREEEKDNEINPNDDTPTSIPSAPAAALIAGGAGLAQNELKEIVLYQPALLANSLEKHIRPRIEKMTFRLHRLHG